MEDEKNQNGWPEYSRLVLSQIADLKCSVEKLDEKLDKVTIDVAQLKVKAALVGGTAGAILATVANVIVKLMG